MQRADEEKRRLRALPALLLLALAAPASAATWTLEGSVGSSYNFRSHLRIEQGGGFSRSLTADYDTRGFETPLYYMLRVGRWEGERGWELSQIHQKIYLQNTPPGVSQFSVSHGFNLLTLNRAFRSGDWTWRFGAGPVITHAEAVINGVSYDGPYELSGAVLLGGVGRRIRLGRNFWIGIDAMLTAGWARPKFHGSPDGRASVTNLALHGLIGLGYRF